MQDEDKTKQQLINELVKMRQRIAELEALDIERQRAEEALRASEKRLKTILDSMQAGVVVIDAETHVIVDANPVAIEMIGGPKERVVGHVCHRFICPAEEGKCPITDLGQTVDKSERVLINANAESIPILKTVTPIILSGRKHLLESFLDITERKWAEETLKRRLEQLTSLNQTSQAVTASLELDQVLAEIVSLASEVVPSDYASVALVDEKGRLSRSAEDLSGVPVLDGRVRDEGFANWLIRSRQAVVVDDIDEDGTVHPRPANETPCTANMHVVQAGVKSFVGLPLVAKDRLLGVLFLHSLRPGTFRGQLPLLTTFANQAAVAIDNARLFEQAQLEIAERKRAEEALAKEHNLLRTLIDNLPDYIFVKDTKSKFVLNNVAHMRVLGVTTPDELVGKTDFDIFPQELAAQYYADEQEVIRSGQPLINREEFTIDPEGKKQWLLTTKVPLRDSRGEIVGLVGMSRDITKRKRAEEALTHERHLLNTLMDNVPDAIYFKDTDSRFIKINKAHANLFGLSDPAQAVGKTDFDFFTEEHAQQAYADEQEVMRSGQPLVGIEEKETWPDGRETWASTTKMPMHDEEGKIIGTFGISRDITEGKRAEEALRESEARYRSLFEDSPISLREEDFSEVKTYLDSLRDSGVKDFRTYFENHPEAVAHCATMVKVVDVNKASLELHKARSKEELMSGLDTIFSEGSYNSFREELVNIAEGRTRFEIETINRTVMDDKIYIALRWFVAPGYKETWSKVFVSIIDITERKRAEEALRESQQLLERTFASLRDAVFIIEADTVEIVDCNPAASEIFGYSRQEMLGQTTTFLHADEAALQEFREHLYPIVEEKGFLFLPEFRMKRKDGKIFFTEHGVMPLEDEQGKRIGWVSVVRDITERKRAEEALAAEKERLAVTLRSIGDGVITTDTQGRIVLINKVAETLTGWTEDEAIGKPLAEIFHIINEKTYQPCENPVEKVLETEGIVGLANHTALVAKGGTKRILADSGAPIHDKDGKIIGVVLVFRDITEKRKIEKELLKASKLESVGILAGGIAHDFNNILTAILGNVSFAKMKLNPEDEMFEVLTAAEKASLRARDLTRQLLTFAKGGAPVKKTASIAELIEDSAGFALRGSRARCEFSIPDDLWPVEIDEGQVSQVVNNLVINADQAMPEGGIIKVGAENVTVSAEHALPLQAGKYVKISIQDQGIGIPEDHLPKIFDPYFTTKQKGSGLGLATSYSIIDNHDGYIAVESELGVGTTFYIYLPVSQKELSREKTVEEKPFVGKGKILVVDDEEMVRETAGRMLQYVGYELDFATDGAEAIELYKKAQESDDPFDVVIMDLTIPGGMGGKEAIKKLLEIDPEVKAIVSSGYSNDPIMSEFRQYGFSGVVAKPYEIEDLSETVAKVIMGMSG